MGETALGGLAAAFAGLPRQRTLSLEREQEHCFIRFRNTHQGVRLRRLRKGQKAVAPAVGGSHMDTEVLGDRSQCPTIL